jgi:hypothetical protein
MAGTLAESQGEPASYRGERGGAAACAEREGSKAGDGGGLDDVGRSSKLSKTAALSLSRWDFLVETKKHHVKNKLKQKVPLRCGRT